MEESLKYSGLYEYFNSLNAAIKDNYREADQDSVKRYIFNFSAKHFTKFDLNLSVDNVYNIAT